MFSRVAKYTALTETCRNATWLSRLIAGLLSPGCDSAPGVASYNEGIAASASNESVLLGE